MNNNLPSTTPEWKELSTLAQSPPNLRTLLPDENRSKKLMVSAGEWTVDLSRQLIDEKILGALLRLADATGWRQAVDDMFSGVKINTTEHRSVLHTALRASSGEHLNLDGQDVIAEVHKELDRVCKFAEGVLSGSIRGYSGLPFKTAVAIGIGGSNLGPEMAYRALTSESIGLTVRFVANIDPNDIYESLRGLNPEETLIIIASKTFTTSETLQNANAAREWILAGSPSPEAVSSHFVALSTNAGKVAEFGISPERMFGIWDWVGGRYSMTSSIGLPLMLSIGPDKFKEMLQGFHDIDMHYRTVEAKRNIPLLLALVNLWNTSFLGMQTHNVVAYNEYLSLLPDHLQQLVMESLGKRVTADGRPVSFTTCPVFFGGIGTNIQHSYTQLLHQGNGVTVPVDFIAVTESRHPMHDQQRDLLLNLLAQANILALGEHEEALAKLGIDPILIPHMVLPGNKPSTILLSPSLTPRSLGQLVALYEHMVHAWGTVLHINAFDQFGVEAGKRMAKKLSNGMTGELTHSSFLQMLKDTTKVVNGL